MSQSARSVWTRAAAGIPAIALAVSGLTVAPQDVQAQTTVPTIGQCVAPAVLQGQLKGQEQKFAINGVQNGIFENSQKVKMTFSTGINFTSSPDGKTGYIIQACRDDFGVATGELKAQKKLSDIRVYPDTLTKPLPEMFVKTTEAQAAKGCATWDVGACGSHNKFINATYSNGSKIVLQGYDAEAGQIVSLSKKGQEGYVAATDAGTGASTTLARMTNVDYSAFVKEVGYTIPVNTALIGNGRPVAALAPARNLN